MSPRWMTLVVLAALVPIAGPAVAESTPMSAPLAPPASVGAATNAPPATVPPAETGRATAQIIGGSLAMALVGAGALLVGHASSAAEGPAVVMFLVGPAAGGYLVCRLGRASRYYDAGCGAAIGGAFLGALTAIPLALLTVAMCPTAPTNGNGESMCFLDAAPGLAIGYVLGTAVGATIGWGRAKKPRAGVAIVPPQTALPATSLVDEWPELRRYASGPGARRAHPTVPLFALSF